MWSTTSGQAFVWIAVVFLALAAYVYTTGDPTGLLTFRRHSAQRWDAGLVAATFLVLAIASLGAGLVKRFSRRPDD